jgi:hypothetical protein
VGRLTVSVGFASEIQPGDAPIGRAYVLSRQMLLQGPLAFRLTRAAILVECKRQVLQGLGCRMALENLALHVRDQYPPGQEHRV